jgi:hypothetical protein
MTDQHRHHLELSGYNELLAEHCELVDHVAALEQRINALASDLRRLGCTVNIEQEIVVDLGHSWQIVRSPKTGIPDAESSQNGH